MLPLHPIKAGRPRSTSPRAMPLVLLGSALLVSTVACDDAERSHVPPGTNVASTGAAAASAALETAKRAAVEKANRKVLRRPRDAAELLLTPERRAKIESAHPTAKGFVDQQTLEQQLFGKALNRGNNEAAVAVFDRLAKGRYVLFVGNIMAPQKDNFELAVRYTPREATDPMGLTATWFAVRFKDVKGYEAAQYRAGQPTAILAKYDGKQETSDAVDLILLEHWDFGTAPPSVTR